ncbi:HTH-type transcriptional regulatory protein gabR [Delftia tsuruhatensis]|uniref:MocR-like pyridoxine biosynthesis transcription factor PdxR n=1 Tax=Delftia tsuruhatensis TaxID=180282 RepID=UPI001E793B65|nr:PLP-dependent aminotransferase family protein [Delftia tsuruhatensis]CAB5705174.1 HTH-type transcriptional regulatory protein gabR [Delftia tsuruhatensis]CAC9689483.1 HTH-type transcriptional regulatory protein gabR [Delftia tsuruhatensis]
MRSSRAVHELLKSQMAGGSLAVGARLPSTRALALDLGVSRSTVTAAYEQLAAEGYLETAPGSRARVAAGAVLRGMGQGHGRGDIPEARQDCRPRLSGYGRRVDSLAASQTPPDAGSPAPVIDFLYGALAFDDFPSLAWRRAYNRAIVQRQSSLSYDAPEGELALRQALQGYLRRARGLDCSAGQIMVVQGSQQAIDLCARVLVDPGETVLVEEPCYLMARRVFEAQGACVQEMPVDEQGVVTAGLAGRRGKLAYVTPSHQFPLGGVLPIGRRRELLSWARASGAWILEDDYDGEFRYGLRPIDALQSIDETGCVIHVGTFSKALSPQMRMGYLVLPPALVPVFREARRLADRHAPRLDQRVLAALIEGGSYERHVRAGRRRNEARRVALLRALERHLPAQVEVEGSASGLHVVAWILPVARGEEDALVRRARECGIGVRPISPLYAAGDVHRRHCCAGLVLGYASLEPDAIEQGVLRLAGVVRQWQAGPAMQKGP